MMAYRAEMRAKILMFIEGFRAENGYAPTYEEVAAGVGLLSKSSVAYYLDGLETAGLISRRVGCPRTLRVTDDGMNGTRVG
jgi:repressor LexA